MAESEGTGGTPHIAMTVPYEKGERDMPARPAPQSLGSIKGPYVSGVTKPNSSQHPCRR